MAWREAGRTSMSRVLSGRGRLSPEPDRNDQHLNSASWFPSVSPHPHSLPCEAASSPHLMKGRLRLQRLIFKVILGTGEQDSGRAPSPGAFLTGWRSAVAESLRTPWHCHLALVALCTRSWTWKLYVREKEARVGEKAGQALTLSMPPLAKLSGLSPGVHAKGNFLL